MPRVARTTHLEIRLLGEPTVLIDGEIQALPASKKTRALLGYLVQTGKPQRRERLCELLWDGPDDPRAGLRWSLAKLRPLLDADGAVRLVADRERASFESLGADVDVATLHQYKDADLDALDTGALAAALARFRGPFLEGLELSSCPGFHAWCIAEREALRALHMGLLTTLAKRQHTDPARAIAHARALVALDPLAESPRLLLLDLLTALGDTRRALEEYDDYVRTLRRELSQTPSFELERRRMALSRTPLAAHAPAEPRRESEPPRSPSAVVPGEATAGRPAPAAFVGRHPELAGLERALAARGHGGAPVVLVLGEPGIGKSRLLEELARRARERGGFTLSGRAFEAELVRPYGAFLDALRSGFGPTLGAEEPHSIAPFFSSGASERTRLYDGVMNVLDGAARRHGRLVLLLDDLHWFDEASTELLHYLARALQASPVLFAVTARRGELADNPAAQRLLRALGREGLTSTIELGPLDAGELRSLVSFVGPSATLDRWLEESGGNPLFALEAARALQAGTLDLEGTLARLIAERLGRLQDAERGLLSWAAALGRSFDVDVLARVTGLGVAELLSSLERLERHDILRGRETGYDFTHDLLRQGAYRQMSSPRQRLVHAQIARALSSDPDPDDALASDVAHHAALAGDPGLAARACITAAQRCLRLFAVREARNLAHRGSRLAQTLPELERIPLMLGLLSVRVAAEPGADLGGTISELAVQARRLGLAVVEARAFFLRSLLEFRQGDAKGALASSFSRIEATRHASPEELGVELAGAARCCLMLEKHVQVSAEFTARAQTILGTAGDHLDLIWSQGLLARLRGDFDAAAERIERALQLTRRQQLHWEVCECLLELGWNDLDRGQHLRVLEHAEQLKEVAGKLGESAFSPVASCLRALVALSESSGSSTLSFDELDQTLLQLRAADANRLLSIVQNRGARLALRAGLDARARDYAERALSDAQRVDRASEVAAARATLAELALRGGDIRLARAHLDELREHSVGADLPLRTAQVVARVHELVAGPDTAVDGAPVPTTRSKPSNGPRTRAY